MKGRLDLTHDTGDEACAFRDSYEKFKKAGAEVIGISGDDSASPKAKTVKVSNVSLGAAEQDIKEFFSFFGDIEYVEMQSESTQWLHSQVEVDGYEEYSEVEYSPAGCTREYTVIELNMLGLRPKQSGIETD
ncbi:hypothetical protein Syun_023361 [Stephania yunnanensis]|uniref:Alkyl hydroperoxide reductase subunit C/ Thiol specific antioxidant domain-containing protein n=1 Tax=Stephania yunnanensis TaxID=152371 RepID=A0AAP0F8T1_9MAGN